MERKSTILRTFGWRIELRKYHPHLALSVRDNEPTISGDDVWNVEKQLLQGVRSL